MENENQLGNGKTEDYKKPGYDGRLIYHKTIQDYLGMIRIMSFSQNLEGWIRSLQSFYDLIHPFIKSDDRIELRTKLNKLRKKIYNCKLVESTDKNFRDLINYQYSQELHEITSELFLSARDLLLPLSGADDDSFDLAGFISGSDI